MPSSKSATIVLEHKPVGEETILLLSIAALGGRFAPVECGKILETASRSFPGHFNAGDAARASSLLETLQQSEYSEGKLWCKAAGDTWLLTPWGYDAARGLSLVFPNCLPEDDSNLYVAAVARLETTNVMTTLEMSYPHEPCTDNWTSHDLAELFEEKRYADEPPLVRVNLVLNATTLGSSVWGYLEEISWCYLYDAPEPEDADAEDDGED
jgi:hypothetical protein